MSLIAFVVRVALRPITSGEGRIMRSTDLKNFTDVWSVIKDRYDSASIERSAIRKGADGVWRYWTSYVDPKDGRRGVPRLSKAKTSRNWMPEKSNEFSRPPICDLKVSKTRGLWNAAEYSICSSVLPSPPPSRPAARTAHWIFTVAGERMFPLAVFAASRDLDSWIGRRCILPRRQRLGQILPPHQQRRAAQRQIHSLLRRQCERGGEA